MFNNNIEIYKYLILESGMAIFFLKWRLWQMGQVGH